MSNFFAALVARAEGRLPVLERRARSLFEPGVGVATPSVAPGESARRDDGAAPGLTAARPSDAASPRSVGAERDAAPSIAVTASRVSPAPRVMSDHTVRDEARFERGSLQAPDLRQIAARPASTGVAAGPRTVQREAANWPPDAGAAARIAHPTPRHADTAATARARAEAGHSEEGVARMPTSRVASAAPPPTPGALRRPGSAPSQPAVLLAKARVDIGSRRDPPPVAVPAPVQISIGRVEIRAVASAAERPRAIGPAAPCLSLDDYLRGRNSGTAR